MAVAYLLAKAGWIAVNGQSQGISSILVVGAATDYGLLLVARYREELREEQSKYTAMRIALKQSWAPIVASGATVILGVLCLLLSDLGSNRGLGPISAVSVALAMLAALTFLPAVLVLLGRAAFWPFRPQYGSEHRHGRGWERVAQIVGRRPWRVLVWSLVALFVAAAFAPTFAADGIPLSQAVRGGTESATGQAALERHYDAGGASPAVIITPEHDWPAVAEAASGVDGVAAVAPFTGSGRPGQPGDPVVVDGLVRLDATLAEAPDSDQALTTVQRPADGGQRREPRRPRGRDDGERPRHPRDRRPRPSGDRPQRAAGHHARAGPAAALDRGAAAAGRDRRPERRRDDRCRGAAVRARVRLPRQRPRHPAGRVRVPRRPGDRLQHLPDDPGPRGVGGPRHEGRHPARAWRSPAA